MPFISSPTLNFTTMVKQLVIEPTYELSSSATQVDEGQQITFTLNTTGVPEGTLVPYSLGGDSGITVDDYIISNTTLQNSTFDTDLSGWSLYAEGGQTNTSYVFYDSFNGLGTAKLYMKFAVHANMKSEITHNSLGTQTNIIRVNIAQADVESKMNVQFTVDDVVHSEIGFWTNIEDFPNMVSNGDGTYSGYIEHEYTYDINSNETYRVHIYADQKQYPGTSTPSIVYVDSVEVQSSENFTIDANGQASVTYLIKVDSSAEGTETLTLSLDNGEDDVSVDIIDQTQSYQLSSSVTQVDEGQQVTFTLNTTNVPSGTSVPYSLGGDSGITVDDLQIYSETTYLTNGTFDTDLSGWGTAGYNKAIWSSHNGGSLNFYNGGKSAYQDFYNPGFDFPVGCQLRATVSDINWTSTNSISDFEAKFWCAGFADMINGHSPRLVGTTEFQSLSMNQLNPGDELYWVITKTNYNYNSQNGVRLSFYIDTGHVDDTIWLDNIRIITSDGNDLTTSSGYTDISDLSGNFTVDASGQASVTYLIKDDSAAEGTETLTLSLDNGEDDVSVDIIDQTLSYQLSSSATQVDEGQQVTFTLSTTGLAENTSVPYTIQNSSDITSQALTNPDFNTDINDWTNTVGAHSAVDFDSKYGGSLRALGRYNNYTSSRATLTHSTSGLQTIKVRVNIPEVTYFHNLAYVSVWKNQTEFLSPTTWVEIQNHPNLSDSGILNHNGNANYWSGYIEIEYTEDVDLNDTYEVYFAFSSTSYSSLIAYCYVDSIEISSSVGFVGVNDLEILDPQTSTFNSISDFSGNFTVDASGQASVTYLIKDDSAVEGTETLTLSLDNGEDDVSVDIIDQTPSTTIVFQDDLQSDASGWTLTASASGGSPPAACAFVDSATSGLSTGSVRMRASSYGYWGQAYINISYNFIEGNNYRLSFDILTHVPSPSNQDYSFGIRTIPSSGVGSAVSLDYISSNSSSGLSNLTGDNFPYTFTHDFVGVSSITSGCQIYISTGGLPYNTNYNAGMWFNNVKIEAI